MFFQQQLVMLWKILFFMILFYSVNKFYFILFIVYVLCFTHDVIMPMMLWVIMFVRS